MNESIESVNNLPRTRIPHRVNATDRSKEEQDQEPFDKTLKKKMKKKKDDQEDNIDTLIVEQTNQNSEDTDRSHDNTDTKDDNTTTDEDNTEDGTESDSSTSARIDIKA